MGWRAFVSLSEGKISIYFLTVSSSVEALPLWPPRRRGSGHGWWSSHQLSTCVCVCVDGQPVGSSSVRNVCTYQCFSGYPIQTGHVVSCVARPAQQSCCCPCLSSPAEHPGTSLHLHGPLHTALSSRRPPAHKMATWPLLPGSHSAPWPLSDCRAPRSAAPPAARCPESGSCTSPAARRLWPREKKVTGKNFCY